MDRVTSPIDHHEGRTPLRRDDQQWVLDYLIQETGKVYHFQGDKRGNLPRSVHSHAMMSKHLGREAKGYERIAEVEASLGHSETAMDYFFLAACSYASAQHGIMDLNDEKRFLTDAVRRSFDQVCALSPYPIEHLEIPWNGTKVYGNLHLNPDVEGPAPLVFFIPGCDVTKDNWPHPHYNQAHQRGMHIFAFDGPGQGESIANGVRLTADNYEHAASAALDYLITRPEIDENQIVLYSASFGSFWGMRFAALDSRLKAVVAAQASLCEKYIQTDLESPRWKQLFAFLTGAETEEELDAVMRDMTMDGYMSKIGCPSLLTTGEYDPRAPLSETYELFDQMTAPAVLWVMADQHHPFTAGPNATWAGGNHGLCIDWLRDRLAGKPIDHVGEVRYVNAQGGPDDPSNESKRWWYES